MSLPAANWYPDPHRQGTLRWWDGTQWTEHVAPASGASPARRQMPEWVPFALALAGAALAVLGMVLPMASVPSIDELGGGEIGIENNSILGQGGLPLLIFPAAILAVWRGWENYADPEGAIAGSIGSAVAIIVFLIIANSRLSVEVLGRSIDVEPGIGIYVSGLGAGLILIGGVLQRAS